MDSEFPAGGTGVLVRGICFLNGWEIEKDRRVILPEPYTSRTNPKSYPNVTVVPARLGSEAAIRAPLNDAATLISFAGFMSLHRSNFDELGRVL
jgi:hypothetical protein